jgi:hypothetical protein
LPIANHRQRLLFEFFVKMTKPQNLMILNSSIVPPSLGEYFFRKMMTSCVKQSGASRAVSYFPGSFMLTN